MYQLYIATTAKIILATINLLQNVQF